ncbi:MAG: tripartite tricarboxylate transporter substrate-binding protein [Alphaproteobacteria bacterium]
MLGNHRITVRGGLTAAAAAIAIGLAGVPAQAQDVDSIHFLIPGGAGGGWDGTARGTGEALTNAGLVGNASYENMSGGGGGVAIAHLIETADSQGGTLMVNSTPIVIRSLQGVFPQSFRDLTPIAATIADYGAFVVAADSELQSWDQVIEAFRQDSTSIKIAGGSVQGGMDHLVPALAIQAAGEDPLTLSYISYDAGGDAMTGLLSGETQVLSTGLGEALGQAQSGQVRILAITADERVADAPDVPTLKELGYDVSFANWRGFFGAPGMSDEQADAYANVLGEVYETDAWETVRSRNGWANLYRPRAEFVQFLEEQEAAIGEMMRKLGVL